MIVSTIVDAGPVVALLMRSDGHHEWAIETFAQLPFEGMVSCEAVVSEACFRLSRWPAGVDGLFRRLNEKSLGLVSMEADSTAVHALMKKYRNVPASYADACLVRLSERHPDAVVVTTDSDFRIYRRNGRQAIPVLMPPV